MNAGIYPARNPLGNARKKYILEEMHLGRQHRKKNLMKVQELSVNASEINEGIPGRIIDGVPENISAGIRGGSFSKQFKKINERISGGIPNKF